MTNINRDTLVENFISNKELIISILLENRKVFDYSIRYIQNTKTGIELMKDLITDFIDEAFYFEETIKNKKVFIDLVDNYDLSEYIDWLVDIYDEDLMVSYSYFQDYTEICEWDEYMVEIMQKAQFDWYTELFEAIRNKFLTYLKWLEN